MAPSGNITAPSRGLRAIIAHHVVNHFYLCGILRPCHLFSPFCTYSSVIRRGPIVKALYRYSLNPPHGNCLQNCEGIDRKRTEWFVYSNVYGNYVFVSVSS